VQASLVPRTLFPVNVVYSATIMIRKCSTSILRTSRTSELNDLSLCGHEQVQSVIRLFSKFLRIQFAPFLGARECQQPLHVERLEKEFDELGIPSTESTNVACFSLGTRLGSALIRSMTETNKFTNAQHIYRLVRTSTKTYGD